MENVGAATLVELVCVSTYRDDQHAVEELTFALHDQYPVRLLGSTWIASNASTFFSTSRTSSAVDGVPAKAYSLNSSSIFLISFAKIVHRSTGTELPEVNLLRTSSAIRSFTVLAMRTCSIRVKPLIYCQNFWWVKCVLSREEFPRIEFESSKF